MVKRSLRGFIDATIILISYSDEELESYEYCDGQWYNSVDNGVVVVLNADDHHDWTYDGKVGGVLSMMKMREGISMRHDLLI